MRLEKYALQIDQLNIDLAEYVNTQNDKSLDLKKSEDKWSKREIIGHLIDSAVANWQRFAEIQYKDRPYAISSYDQVLLVKINAYQQMDIMEVMTTCIAINRQISHLLTHADSLCLNYEVIINNEAESFDFLISDYIAHLEHHIRQIKG